MAEVAPHAVNWQIKQSPFGEESEIPTDLIRLLKIVRNSGYHGYLPIEIFVAQRQAVRSIHGRAAFPEAASGRDCANGVSNRG